MKKLLLSLSLMAAVTFSFAQTRHIDWSTEAILTPDTLYSSPTNTTAMPLEFVCKNNGTDTLLAGDSLLFQFLVTNSSGSQIIVAYPSTSTLSVVKIARTILPGDTMHYKIDLSVNVGLTTSANILLVVLSHVINRPGLDFETSTTNNTKIKTSVWYNQQKWAVGIADVNASLGLSVYPNPAKDMVNFSLDNSHVASINIMDITGKLVEVVLVKGHDTKVDLSNYNSGIYLYQLKSTDGQLIKSGKFNVSK